MYRKFIGKVLLLSFSFLLFSCINTERNIKINKDGSGTENQTLNIGKNFYDIMIGMASALDSTNITSIRDSLYNDDDFTRNVETKIGDQDGLKLNSVNSVTNPDSSRTFFLSYDFDTVEKIASAMNIKNSNEDKKSSTEIYYKDKGDQVNFHYKYITAIDTMIGTMSEQQRKGFAEMFRGKALIFNIEFPYDIESSDANDINGRTASWRFPMDKFYLEKGEFELNATLRK